MKTYLNVIMTICFLFLGGCFLFAICKFTVYNGFGKLFEYTKAENIETIVEIDTLNKHKTIFYRYSVNQKQYEAKQTVYIGNIVEYDFYEENVYYNKLIPWLSYVGNPYPKIRSSIVEMIFSCLLLLFCFWSNKYCNFDKYILTYGSVYNRKTNNNPYDRYTVYEKLTCEEVLIVHKAKEHVNKLLDETGKFHPFAMLKDKEGNISSIFPEIGNDISDPKYLMDLYTKTFEKEYSNKCTDYIAGVICVGYSDGNKNISKRRNLVEIRLLGIECKKTIQIIFDIDLNNKIILHDWNIL